MNDGAEIFVAESYFSSIHLLLPLLLYAVMMFEQDVCVLLLRRLESLAFSLSLNRSHFTRAIIMNN